jgi:3-hydroxymyristoyl/3-hydroxydecanoyl-(acyl carrier protein) dehydratase/malonyl CoA-acyl carrier protein transacylase
VIETLAWRWWMSQGNSRTGATGRAVALVARDPEEATRLVDAALAHLRQRPEQPISESSGPLRDRLFYAAEPLGSAGTVAFVYPGSGNDFAGMGREIALRWPAVLRRQDRENRKLASQYLPAKFWSDPPTAATVQERIFAQVALGSLASDVLALLAVRPAAAIGYSLGESAALFSLRAWPDRDRMLEAMHDSTLFVSDLTGTCDAARQTWGLPAGAAVDWQTGIVERSPKEVGAALAGLERVYLQIVNAPRECVVGGERAAVASLLKRLGAPLVPVPETTTMHCPVVRVVAHAYRELHHLPTSPPDEVRFYSTGLGRVYALSPDAIADAILLQALDTIDFPAVIEDAYADGARLFVEMGPGASCSRMISAILGDRPHRARSVCLPGSDGLSGLWRTLAMLVAQRVPVDLGAALAPESPVVEAIPGRTVVVPVGAAAFAVVSAGADQGVESSTPVTRSGGGAVRVAGVESSTPRWALDQLAGTVGLQEARAQAHGAFFRFNDTLQRTFADTLAFQGQLVEALVAATGSVAGSRTGRQASRLLPREVALDREQCLEFAVGSIARVLGPAFAEVDTFPTRVRLPDEPLMLVDRILTIVGEPRSLTSGRVVTEHDVLPGAWYLDSDRIPTCIAVEAGQADLFLSGYLGIDFHTRGRAVYRLLDAAVTFHRGLPGPGAVIHYDIHIDTFFRQDRTHLFRFRFEGTVGGQPLLTMTDGCAGFFNEDELAAGRGVVHTEFQRRPRPGVQPNDSAILPPMQVESYDEKQVDALRDADLAGCFGPLFANLDLREPMRLPGGRMRLVHRVTHLDPTGGRFGIGLIRAEADVHPDDWFLTCHFIDDQVMPGTLMYECCLHTLRIFLMRLGWVGEHGQIVWEPVPGVASRLKCRGQVTARTHTVTYEVVLKERGYRPEPYAIVDALMYADGKPIVDITDMTIRLTGLTQEGIAALWARRQEALSASEATYTPRPPLFDTDRILAFAVGKPSVAFGEPYRIFDEQRTIARLPGPPFSFLHRIVAIDAEPWKMTAGGVIVAEYDVPPDAWYFASERAPRMPFAVLLEAALQPCGWLAAYVGSALCSPVDLRFRNLGGQAELSRPATPHTGTITTKVRITRVSSSAGMIIQDFDFDLSDHAGSLFQGSTTFGFFSAEALAQQVGLRDARPEASRGGELPSEPFPYPRTPPYPDAMLGMIDQVEQHVPDGGPAGLGLIQGSKIVRSEEWFFKAHFYQDPVCPGSLGLESFLQLLKVAAGRHWQLGPRARFEANVGARPRWTYRGQVVPRNRTVNVWAFITSRDDERRELTADGVLAVDGLPIYRMQGFTIRAIEE